MNRTMYETENGIIYKASMNASKYVEELIQKAIEDGKLVQVVRCGECAQFDKWRDGTKRGKCKYHEVTMLTDDYCNYGDRRE